MLGPKHIPGAHNATGHSASSFEQTMVKKKRKNTASDWTSDADDNVVVATSQKALEQMILDLTEGFREMGSDTSHAKKNWSPTHKL